MIVALIVIAVIAALLAFAYVSLYNGIVMKGNRCDNAWQTIDAQLQRRNDLIPNLVETVKDHAELQPKTLEQVTDARAAVASAPTPEDKMVASGELTSALSQLIASVEDNPKLKASSTFQQLQQDLADTENKIGYARLSYNDCVLAYNNAITTFPGSLVAGTKFHRREGFTIVSGSVQDIPEVKF